MTSHLHERLRLAPVDSTASGAAGADVVNRDVVNRDVVGQNVVERSLNRIVLSDVLGYRYLAGCHTLDARVARMRWHTRTLETRRTLLALALIALYMLIMGSLLLYFR